MKKLLVLISLCLFIVGCKKDNTKPIFRVSDLPTETNVANGKHLFENGSGSAAACSTCHSIDGEDRPTAPTLKGFANYADKRVEGETQQEYALNSIIAPGHYVVDGYRNTMPSNYAEKYSKQQIADLIAYLLTLNE